MLCRESEEEVLVLLKQQSKPKVCFRKLNIAKSSKPPRGAVYVNKEHNTTRTFPNFLFFNLKASANCQTFNLNKASSC